jgi:subtilisin family serine protease
MNRNNFFGHAALAVALVMLAAFVGQMRRMQSSHDNRETVERRVVAVADGPEAPADRAEQFESDGEVLVRFREGTTEGAVRAITERLNDRLLDRFDYVDGAAYIAAVADEDGLDAERVAAEYRLLPEVEYAEPNAEINLYPPGESSADEAELEAEAEAAAEEAAELASAEARGEVRSGDDDGPPVIMAKGPRPNDPMFDEQWSLLNTGQNGGTAGADIRATLAWAKTTGSRKVVVAVLDTGVDYRHPDLAGNMWKRPASLAPYADEHRGQIDDRFGFDSADGDGDPFDDNGHGTHCAGIVGAEGGNGEGITGVNWQVEIMPLKFMDAGGRGSIKAAIEAIDYVIGRKRAGVNVRVISASWGGTFSSRALEDAIRRAGDEGIIFIAAAGNSRTNNDRLQHYPSGYQLPNVLAVAALQRRDALASFSNYGPKTVHLAAPGAEILSTWPGNQYEEHSGTSMATPEVAGVAALVLAADPDMTVAQLRERLLSSVDKLPALAGKVSSGGRLNAARAVRAE